MGENLLCGRGALQGGEHSHSRVSFRGRRGKPTEQLLCGDLGSLLGETPTGARRGNANAASTGSASPPASHWPGPRSTPPMQMPLGGPPPQWGPHWLSHPSVCSGHPISPGGSPASQHSPRSCQDLPEVHPLRPHPPAPCFLAGPSPGGPGPIREAAEPVTFKHPRPCPCLSQAGFSDPCPAPGDEHPCGVPPGLRETTV